MNNDSRYAGNGSARYSVKEQKDAVRQKYRSLRRSLSADERAERDRKICEYACGLVSFRFAEYVLMYAATEEEINIYDIARAALERGKKVAFPRCRPEDHTMNYHIVESLDVLSPESYGLLEPPESLPIYDAENGSGNAVCFVPGLVYDKEGYRLGYGKGFYDRFLTSFKGSSVGVVYSDFILPTVPRGRFDMKVDILLSEKGVRISEG